eukprot:68654-Chlamydomonas_euryale.AAC.6
MVSVKSALVDEYEYALAWVHVPTSKFELDESAPYLPPSCTGTTLCFKPSFPPLLQRRRVALSSELCRRRIDRRRSSLAFWTPHCRYNTPPMPSRILTPHVFTTCTHWL